MNVSTESNKRAAYGAIDQGTNPESTRVNSNGSIGYNFNHAEAKKTTETKICRIYLAIKDFENTIEILRN